MRTYAPLTGDHPAIGTTCPRCGQIFAEGDRISLAIIGPASDEDSAKQQAGRAYIAEADLVHADCKTGNKQAD